MKKVFMTLMAVIFMMTAAQYVQASGYEKKGSDHPKEMKAEYNVENQKNLDYVSHGFIAQEVKEAIDKHGDTTFGGWHLDKTDNETQRVKKNMFIMPLIKAVQELTARVKELEAK